MNNDETKQSKKIKVWYKKPSYIVLMASGGLTVLCFALIAAWEGFAAIASITMSIMFGAAMVIAYKRHKTYKNKVKEQRYIDAYLYAEEMGDLKLIHAFKYPRAKERQLKAAIKYRYSLFSALLGGFLLSLVLLYYFAYGF